MTEFLVGARLLATITVKDKALLVAVEPASIAFRLVAPTLSDIPLGTYAWDGALWTSSEGLIVNPTRGATGVFLIGITIPYVNTAAGQWHLGWKSIANGSGYGESSGQMDIVVTRSRALA